MYQDGLIDLWCHIQGQDISDNQVPKDSFKLQLWHALVLSGVAAVFNGVEKFKEGVGIPDAEFVIEVEVFSVHKRPVEYQPLGNGHFYRWLPVFKNLPIFLPRLTFNSRSDFDQIIDVIDRDIYDALGVGEVRPSLKARLALYKKPGGHGVFWQRTYHYPARPPYTVTSIKQESAKGEMMECVGGGFGMLLKVYAQDQSLHFESYRYFCQFFDMRLPLPHWLSPGKTHVIHEDLNNGNFKFTISMDHCQLGQTFYQEGVFHQKH